MRTSVALVLLGSLAACAGSDDSAGQGPAELAFPAPTHDTSPTGPAPEVTKSPAPTGPPATALETLPEVVYVFQRDFNGGNWMCTGALVAKDVVITAAHCLDPGQFELFQVVAPLLPARPRVEAHSLGTFTDDVLNVGNPDVGLLKLETPIDLPQYAQLTDVTTRVEASEKLKVLSIVRSAVDFEAPFKSVEDLELSSTIDLGYDHGFGTKNFSHGGDSGAGLFLIEDGKPTHKLVGIARQPEPDRDLDHFTRVDATLLEWFRQTTETGPPAPP